MPYLVLGVALLIGVFLVGRWYVNAEPGKIIQVVKWTVIVIAGALVLFFGITGRIGWALYALPILFPWFMRARAVKRAARNWSKMKSGEASRPGQTSNVETRYLRVELDHESGAMVGQVIAGKYSGRSFDQMSLDELVDLLGECANSEDESAQILSTYLDRQYPDDWRERAAKAGAGGGSGAGSGGGRGAMNPDEAHEILGLEPGASMDDIKSAHKRLMSKIHPDHGGSTYLAAKINQAKDLLLEIL